MIQQLPNFLSLIRLLGLPPLLAAAIFGDSRPWFIGLLCAAWTTDALDGFIARRLHAESDLGRKLDSWGDYITTILCVAGVGWLWPEIARQEWRWFAVGLAAYFLVIAYGFLRWRQAPCYHTWLAKILAVAFPLSLAPLLAGWSAFPFHGFVFLQVAAAAEELAISFLLPGYSGSVPTVRHAWLQREAGRRAGPMESRNETTNPQPPCASPKSPSN